MRSVPLPDEPPWSRGGIARLAVTVSDAAWPEYRMRTAATPEDCIAVADPASEPLPLAASRLTTGDEGWVVDPAISVDESWHGACVLSREDGRLVGFLLVEEDRVRVALWVP